MNLSPAIIRSTERFHHDLGWLDAYHTFSFDPHPDQLRNGFRSLRIINDDTINPSTGFPTHSHRDMEIFTLMLSGEIEHRDSEGNQRVIRAGDFQYMAAGRGVSHSEWNHGKTEPAHLIQIWIKPDAKGAPPRYEHRTVGGSVGRLDLLAGDSGRDGSIRINQNAEIYHARLQEGAHISRQIAQGRHAWVQVVEGALTVAGKKLDAGDGLGVSGAPTIEIRASSPSQILFFDLP